MTEKNKTLWLIFVATLVRCIIAMTIGLGNDEVYYLTYAQHLQWNYFDHPPMVAFLIRLSTFNLFFTSAFFVRLGAIILAGVNTYLIYDIGKRINNEKTGFIAALLFTSSIYSSIIAGVFIMPDSPQLFFWILSILLLVKIVSIDESKKINFNLLYFGLASGLCIMSKVHGVFLWFGFVFYILFFKRSLLTNLYLYLALLISLCIISPILIWNINNNFITYTFHSQRVIINNGINPTSFLRESIGGILYNNPINYLLIITAMLSIFKNKIVILLQFKQLLLLLSLPLIVILLFISLFRDTLPHWSGPAFVALILLLACYIVNKKKKKRLSLFKTVIASGIFIFTTAISGIVVINYYPGTIGNTNEKSLGEGDITLDMYNWDFFKSEFNKVYFKNFKSKKTTTTFIINNRWFPGAHIDNYIAQPLHLDFVAIGNLDDIHTYEWLNQYRKKLKLGDDAYFITVSNNFTNPNDLYKSLFKKISEPITIKQFRNHKPVRNMYVYLMKEYQGEINYPSKF
jgi:Dolichyl-phosphate-mannose-protein mannosyltransferase